MKRKYGIVKIRNEAAKGLKETRMKGGLFPWTLANMEIKENEAER